jgi:hypothetical protein
MRRDNTVDIRKAKIIAKVKYAGRQIDKWIKWRINIKGSINYKQLKEKQDEYGIRSESWRKHS